LPDQVISTTITTKKQQFVGVNQFLNICKLLLRRLKKLSEQQDCSNILQENSLDLKARSKGKDCSRNYWLIVAFRSAKVALFCGAKDDTNFSNGPKSHDERTFRHAKTKNPAVPANHKESSRWRGLSERNAAKANGRVRTTRPNNRTLARGG